MAVPPDPTTFVVELDDARAAAKITLGLTAGSVTYRLWRVGPSGTIAGVRGSYPGDASAAPTTIIVRDYEAPLGVPLTYFAQMENADGHSNAPSRPFEIETDPASDAWLIDLSRPANSLQISIESLPELEYPIEASIHRILGRRGAIVTSAIARTPEFDLSFFTWPYPAGAEFVRDAIGNGIPVLLRTPPDQGVGNLYLQPLGWKESRVSRIAFFQERRYSVHAVQVLRPDPTLQVPRPPADYAGVKATHATYADVELA